MVLQICFKKSFIPKLQIFCSIDACGNGYFRNIVTTSLFMTLAQVHFLSEDFIPRWIILGTKWGISMQEISGKWDVFSVHTGPEIFKKSRPKKMENIEKAKS